MTIRMKDAWRYIGKCSIIELPIILIFSFLALQIDWLWLKIIFGYFAICSLGVALCLAVFILKDVKKAEVKILEDIQNIDEYEYQIFGDENKPIFSMLITRELFFGIWDLNYSYSFLDDKTWKKFKHWLTQFPMNEKIYCVHFCVRKENVKFEVLKKYKKHSDFYIFI